MTDLRATLVVLRRRVDDHFAAALTRTPEAFECRAGCWACCRPRFSVFEIEAVGIREALDRLEPQIREQIREQGRTPEIGHCALLVDGQCSVYDQRPVICRSHGLAVAVATDDGVVMDHCELNYVGIEVPPASVLALEAVNRPLSMMAEMWAGGGQRIGLDALAREP